MECKKCGNPLKEGAPFCWFCGTKLETTNQEEISKPLYTNEKTEILEMDELKSINQEIDNQPIEKIDFEEEKKEKFKIDLSFFKHFMEIITTNFKKIIINKWFSTGLISCIGLIILVGIVMGVSSLISNRNTENNIYNQAVINTITNTYSLLIPKDFIMSSDTKYAEFSYVDSLFKAIPITDSTFTDNKNKVKAITLGNNNACKNTKGCEIVGNLVTKDLNEKEVNTYYIVQKYKNTSITNEYYQCFIILENTNSKTLMLINARYSEDQKQPFNTFLDNIVEITKSITKTEANNNENTDIYESIISVDNM